MLAAQSTALKASIAPLPCSLACSTPSIPLHPPSALFPSLTTMVSTSHLPAASYKVSSVSAPGGAFCTAGEPSNSSILSRGSAALTAVDGSKRSVPWGAPRRGWRLRRWRANADDCTAAVEGPVIFECALPGLGTSHTLATYQFLPLLLPDAVALACPLLPLLLNGSCSRRHDRNVEFCFHTVGLLKL